MKNKLLFSICILVGILIVGLSVFYAKSILDSDLPFWLKIILLG